MLGVRLRLFTDEDVDPRLADRLRQRGYDAESCHEVGRSNRGISDSEQLAYATLHGRAILTYNARDYIPLDRAWKAAGRQHAGIIVSAQIPDVGELLRRVERHLGSYSPQEQIDQLLWLTNWTNLVPLFAGGRLSVPAAAPQAPASRAARRSASSSHWRVAPRAR